MLFIDDLLLRSLGIVLKPFDLIYILEVIGDYSRGLFVQENLKRIRDRIKENRLLYELGDTNRAEYMRIDGELNNKVKEYEKIKKINLNERIDLLK